MASLSIIIPTKNRYNCLFPVISALCTFINDLEVEIIVQDNSDSNCDAIRFFTDLNDNRVKYFYTKRSLSIADNTILAIENSSKNYLTFIGDDDLVSPYICDAVDLMDEKKIEALMFNAGYYWWDSVDFYSKSYYLRKCALWIPHNINDKFVMKNSIDELNLSISKGSTGMFNLPRFYHGIVKRSLLVEIKNRTGTYMVGSCPDISFATSIALLLEKYYYVNYPFTIYGASKNSAAGLTARRSHYSRIEDVPALRKDILNSWNIFIPRIWTEQTIYAQTTFEVFSAFKTNLSLNYNSFYASIIVNEFFLIKYFKGTLYKYYKQKPFHFLLFCYFLLVKIGGKFIRLLRSKTKQYPYDVYIESSVFDCMVKLKEIPFIKK